MDFYLYREGEFVTKIAIAQLTDKGIVALPQNFATFENLMIDFCSYTGQTIKNSKKLAEMMAGKARLLSDVIDKALTSDEEKNENSTLKDQLTAFRQILIHDITPKSFADVYAQTICYGMFAARLHDPILDSFSRQKAAELIPKSNPFLRKLFSYIAGPDIDDRIKWIVDSLVDVFLACNVIEILKNYGKTTKMEDPIIHFYETFLSEYDPALRKARGVWYTPAPVVNFIVRAVDDVLKTDFGLPQGLADTSKVNINIPNPALKNKEKQEVHKVQILDPATGTGTFLAETIKHIHQKFEGKQGIWSSYVEEHLLPRLNGFELLMASYAMAHLQLDLLLTETGYKATNNQRLKVYLTNSLEESHPDTTTLFANWLSAEANEANHIKRDAPVMCIMGNPPYAVSSTNKGEWIQHLIADYKKDLNEKKINLDDDYIKFIRLGQNFIDKNGSGVLAYISNNSFIDGITHRQMRKHLLESFDKIYILDLHGNAKKKEVCFDGSADQNVFDIMQGVSINIFVKTGKKKPNELGKVFHFDLQGKKSNKFDFLNNNSLKSVEWTKVNFTQPNYFFVPKNFDGAKEYEKGFKIDELFEENIAGIETVRDDITIHFDSKSLKNVVQDFLNLEETEIAKKYHTQDARDWKIKRAKEDIKLNINNQKVWQDINYRPFDVRKTFYSGKQNGFICNGRYNVMKHLLKDNLGFIAKRGFDEDNAAPCFLTLNISDRRAWSRPGMQGAESIFPLYLYPEKKKEKQQQLFPISENNKQLLKMNLKYAQSHYKQIKTFFDNTVLPFYKNIDNPTDAENALFEENKSNVEEAKTALEAVKIKLDVANNQNIVSTISKDATEEEIIERIPNLNAEIVSQIADKLGLAFTTEKSPILQKEGLEVAKSFAPIDILDYIYAVLHSPNYREKYKEFLKIDFPRVPFPSPLAPKEGIEEIQRKFWDLVTLGAQLRQIHLLESVALEKYMLEYQIEYPINGNNLVGKPKYVHGKVFINDTQYFDNVPAIAWNFFIGGYQPAQKWLKDRKERLLTSEDVAHYQKIIIALSETDKIMKKIDKIKIE